MSSEGNLRALIYDSDNGRASVATFEPQHPLQRGEFRFIAVRFEAGKIDAIIDEEYIALPSETLNLTNIFRRYKPIPAPFIIGADNNGSSYFTGVVDEFSVFNDSLSRFIIGHHRGNDVLRISASLLNQAGTGEWTPIESGEIISNDKVLLRANVLNDDIECESVQFFLTTTLPDLITKKIGEWVPVGELHGDMDEYNLLMNTSRYPDGQTFHMVAQVKDNEQFSAFSAYRSNFSINNYDQLLNIEYKSTVLGRIGPRLMLDFTMGPAFKSHIHNLGLYVTYNGKTELLADNVELSNSNTYSLSSLEDWAAENNMDRATYDIFLTAAFTLDYPEVGLGAYHYNYSLPTITFDWEPPQGC